MRLEFLGWKPEGAALRTGVRAALHENYVTPDLGGDKRTVEIGDWLPPKTGPTPPQKHPGPLPTTQPPDPFSGRDPPKLRSAGPALQGPRSSLSSASRFQ